MTPISDSIDQISDFMEGRQIEQFIDCLSGRGFSSCVDWSEVFRHKTPVDPDRLPERIGTGVLLELLDAVADLGKDLTSNRMFCNGLHCCKVTRPSMLLPDDVMWLCEDHKDLLEQWNNTQIDEMQLLQRVVDPTITASFSSSLLQPECVPYVQRPVLSDVPPIAADLHCIISVQTANPVVLAQAKAYYSDVSFASQLCRESASAKNIHPALSVALAEAHKMLELIVASNTDLKSDWPSSYCCDPVLLSHEALLHPLLHLDLLLQRYTTQFVLAKKWKPRFHVLRGSRLYYSNSKTDLADLHEHTLAFVQSNPTPDGHYCIDLKGAHARCCVIAAFAEYLFHAHSQAAVSCAAAHQSTDRRSLFK